MINRAYFYSAYVRNATINKHIDGVLIIKSFLSDPRLAWKEARRDTHEFIKDCEPYDIHITALSRL
jgi:hypothetical protein